MKHIKLRTILALGTICAVGLTGEVFSKATFMVGGNSLPFEGKKENAVMSVDFSCPAGQDFYMGECKAKCDEKLYPLVGEPDNTLGVAETCESVFGNRFVYASCHDGWTLADGKCIADACEGFNLIDEPSEIVGTFESCKAGHVMKYKYTDCHDGWTFINGDCVIKSCDSTVFPYKSKPDDAAGTVTRCKSGVTTVYGYQEPCHDGWTFKDGQCLMNSCDANVYPFDKEPDKSKGTVISCQAGEKIKYGYSDCIEGYDFNNGKCEEPCKYIYKSKEELRLNHCSTGKGPQNPYYYYYTCERDGVTYYGCQYCYNYYTLSPSGDGTCVWDPCHPHDVSPAKTCPAHANCKHCDNGNYAIESCETGYKLNVNTHVCQLDCHIGDYFYDDDTCSKELNKNKTVIGVVINSSQIIDLEEAYLQYHTGGNAYLEEHKITLGPIAYYSKNSCQPGVCNKYMQSVNFTTTDWAYSTPEERSKMPAVSHCFTKTTGNKPWVLPKLVDVKGRDSSEFQTVNSALKRMGADPIRSYAPYWHGTCTLPSMGYYGGQKTMPDCKNSNPKEETGAFKYVRCVASYIPGDGRY